MNSTIRARLSCFAVLLAGSLATPAFVDAQDAAPRRAPAPPPVRTPVGLDVFGGAGFTWPAAEESFDALDLSSTPIDFGGGARVTGLWRGLFAQVAASRWSDSGERAFIGSDGTSFPLGIPLDVDATFVDATIGVRQVIRAANGRISFLPYIGAGAGAVRYEEHSPFAEPGDDLDTTKPSYHVLVGADIPLGRWLAVAIDGRYRYIPGLLGDQGASAVLDEDALGGFQTSLGLRIGFGGPPHVVAPPKPAQAPAQAPSAAAPVRTARSEGMLAAAAPVYLLPDAARTPLRTLATGTAVRILSEKGDWVEVEFNDPQFGRRVGWVQSRFIRRDVP